MRGAILRLALNRRRALIVGLALSLPAVWLLLVDYRWEAWYTDALVLVIGGSGAALALAGISGRRPDWVDAEVAEEAENAEDAGKAEMPKDGGMKT